MEESGVFYVRNRWIVLYFNQNGFLVDNSVIPIEVSDPRRYAIIF
jgi:hypothetical protein